MQRKQAIEKTIGYLKILPEDKVEEALDYIEYLYNKNDNSILTEGISRLAAKSKSFDFLEYEEDIYTINDVKELPE